MGSFYVNVTLLDVSVDSVQAAWPGPAFACADGSDVLLFAEADDQQEVLSAGPLSGQLGCVAVAFGVHDDDLCFFEVHRDGGQLVAGAVPDPAEVFDLPEPSPPSDAAALVAAVGRGDVDALASALDREPLFASDSHESIARALGLPTSGVDFGFRYLAEGEDEWDGPPLVRW